MPGRKRQRTPLTPRASTPRGVLPIEPGTQLGKFRTQARTFARGRLSPDYNDAVQLVAHQAGRDLSLLRLDRATLARIEQAAADIRMGRDKPPTPKLIDLFRRRKRAA
jgi:hypothetical protein